MFRSAILITVGAAITAFVSFFIVVSYPVLPRGERTVHRIATLWARILLWISSVKTEVIGRENILQNRPQIFMANHQSGFDILIVLAHMDTYFAWIAKKELFSIPIFGDAMKKGGYISIDRKNFIRAMRSISDAARIIQEGKSVMTFPEGTRSMDNRVHPFKKGVFHLALKAGVPIVPVTIIGSGDIMPKKSLRVHPGKITMVIDKPIDVTTYSEETVDDLIHRVHEVVASHYHPWRPDLTVKQEEAA
ncbi:MAG TPA: lysophospholipid acyltransferase family protein [Syntrophales bacterium]|nr:lysophospholipid acyltransferase family protein [Syntrophales bacterium]